MKNKLFSKVTTQATVLVMGSLVAFSGQALAFSSNTSNNREFTNADALGNSESLIAQLPKTTTTPNPNTPLTAPEKLALAKSVANAFSTVGNAIALTQAAAIPATQKLAIARSLSTASTILGDALADSNSTAITTGDAAAIAQSISSAETVIGNAQATASSLATTPGGKAVASSLATARTAAGKAVAVASSVAS